MEDPLARREAPSTAGRKRRRAPSAARAAAGCVAGASFLVVALHHPLDVSAAAVPYESPAATRVRDLTTATTVLPSDSSSLPSSLSSLAALASPWLEDGPDDVSTNDHDERENDRPESPTFDSEANLETKEINEGAGDDDTRGVSDSFHAGTKDSLSTYAEGSQHYEQETEGPTTPPSEFVLQLGDFEREVQMRVSDYQADLKDAMRSVRDRLVAARSRHRRHDEQQHMRDPSTNLAQADVGPSQEHQENSLQHEESTSRPSIIDVDDGAASSSSKQRSRGNAALTADEGWGELVSTRSHRPTRDTTSEVSARAPKVTAATVEMSKAPSFATRAFVKRKKVKVSASGHLHRVHRDLKGGGEGEAEASLSPSHSYVPQVARIASRKLYNAALRVADPHRSLRSHARMLGTALLYAAAAAIMLRMLLWALFMRR